MTIRAYSLSIFRILHNLQKSPQPSTICQEISGPQSAQLSGLHQPIPEPTGQTPQKLSKSTAVGEMSRGHGFSAGTAGQFFQTVVLQVEAAEATEIPNDIFWKCSQTIAMQVKFAQVAEIPKKTFWKCSQAIALQVKFLQVFQAIKYSSRKLSQIHVFQMQGALFRMPVPVPPPPPVPTMM